MNVFVLCTGRCGSTTFSRACRHMSNFTAAHESRVAHLGDERLDYPDNHIEVDNRLSWVLGRLDARFGDKAHYVHLSRDKEETARSYCSRLNWSRSIATTYRDSILMAPYLDGLAACRDYVHTVTANIEMFLSDKTHVMAFRMEEASERFPQFWDWIGASGNFEAAAAEWEHRHNATDFVSGLLSNPAV